MLWRCAVRRGRKVRDVERISDEEIALLGLCDDDFYGFWEVDWYFNGKRPDWAHDARATFFSGLVRRGFMDVFYGPLQTERPPLAIEAALQALADPRNWLPPSRGQETGYYVMTSSTGIAATRTAS
jgi:hypothetical protein